MIKLQVIGVLHCSSAGQETACHCPLGRHPGEQEPIHWEEIEVKAFTSDNKTTVINHGAFKIITKDPAHFGQFKVNDIISLVPMQP